MPALPPGGAGSAMLPLQGVRNTVRHLSCHRQRWVSLLSLRVLMEPFNDIDNIFVMVKNILIYNTCYTEYINFNYIL